MAWVKRNLGLVIGGVVALALMAVAGYYLWTQIQKDAAITADLQDKTARYNELANRPLHPGNDRVNNIDLAKQEAGRLQEFLMKVRAEIATPEVPKNISNKEFRAMLDNTINELQREADRVGVTLPQKDYWFTFAPQKTAVDFKAIDTLTHQLMDVKALTQILYDAKVHDLVALRRVPASADDNNTQDFLTDKKAKTNDFAIVSPYELTFQGFSSELAKVMEGLVNSKRCFVIRSVAVATAPTAEQTAQQALMAPTSAASIMSRYYPGRYMPQQPVAAAPQPRRPGNVLLDETKLKFVLTVDAVRLKPLPDRTLAQADVQPSETPEQ